MYKKMGKLLFSLWPMTLWKAECLKTKTGKVKMRMTPNTRDNDIKSIDAKRRCEIL